jgi:hypothetical protein
VLRAWESGSISDLEFLEPALRHIFFRLHSRMYIDNEDEDALNVMSILFKQCTIKTLAIPRECAVAIEDTQWLAEKFPDVKHEIRFEYSLEGEQYVLFGSKEMTGDRACDSV